MRKRINPDNDIFDPLEEYFKKENDSMENDSEVFFPEEESKPPHY